MNTGARYEIAIDGTTLVRDVGVEVQPGKVVVEIPAWNRNYISEEH